MSFLNISDQTKRDAMVKEYLEYLIEYLEYLERVSRVSHRNVP